MNAPDSAAPPRSVEEVKAMLDTTEKGGVRNSIRNCLTVFQYDPLLAGALAYNLLTDRTDLVKPIGCQRLPGTSMTDTDMKYIRLYLEETYGLTSERKIADAADLAAHQNSYHPVRDYLNGLVWDGTAHTLLPAALSGSRSGHLHLRSPKALFAGRDPPGIQTRLQV